MRNKYLIAISVLAMLFAAVPVSAEDSLSGSCGESISWTLSDSGVLTLSGSGATYDYEPDFNYATGEITALGPWYTMSERVKSIVVGEGITTIGKNIFSELQSVTSVSLPSSLSEIHQNAFLGCVSLPSISLPAGVSVGEEAFWRCDGIRALSIPNGAELAYQAFGNMASLESLTVGSDVNIGQASFYMDSELKTVRMADGVFIGPSAFERCSKLNDVVFEGIAGLESYAFCNDEGLESFAIPASVTAVPSSLFFEDENLKTVYIPRSVKSIGDSAFYGCNALSTISYEGSEAEWAEINIETFHNDALKRATIRYNQAAGGAYSTSEQGISSPWNSGDAGDASTAGSETAANEEQTAAAYSAPSPQATAVSVHLNGESVVWSEPASIPFIDENSRTMVPLRAVGDALGLEVTWDASNKKAVFSKNSEDADRSIEFPIGSKLAYWSMKYAGERNAQKGEYVMDTEAVIVNNRTYAPVRYLAEFFGYSVEWDAPSRTVLITGYGL